MACTHKRIRCTNCEFFCLDCGAKVDPPQVEKLEEEKKPVKKGAKKK